MCQPASPWRWRTVRTATFLCSCPGVPYGQDVVFPLDKLPEDATAEQRLERWCQHVMRNPAAGHFDAKRFIADMRARGLLPCFQR